MTTMGKYRHLSQCATEAGHFFVLAIDHRGNLISELNKSAAAPLSDDDFAGFKQTVIGTLIDEASGVLTDPAYGLGIGIAQRVIPGRIGILAPIEVTDYDVTPSQRQVNFIPHWSIAKIKQMGGSGVKLLLPYHPDAHDSSAKHKVVERIVEKCRTYDIPFYLEPIPFSLDATRRLTSVELTQITVHMARLFSHMGADVLKLQFPLDPEQTPDESQWRKACDAVNLACSVPWALLSAGVSYDVFVRQARIACESGASGLIVGRALWNEAVTLQGEARLNFLRTTGIQRMKELAAICKESARAWYERVAAPTDTINWYKGYAEMM
jgi:tagatose 1,6-diphosphate aldolase